MTDCSNAEMRDLLPDFVRGTLGTEALRRVEGHVAGCGPCTEEAALLRLLGHALAPAPAVDVAAIVARLPKAPLERRPAWYAQPMLRMAAALLLFAGVGSFFISRSGQVTIAPPRVASASASASATLPAETIAAVERGTGAGPAVAELSASVAGDLTDAELRTLLESIDNLESAPAAESEELVRGLPGSSGLDSGL